MRADSGFVAQDLFEFLEQSAIAYVVVATLTCFLKLLAASIRDWKEVDEEYALGECCARLQGWDREWNIPTSPKLDPDPPNPASCHAI